MVLIKDATEKAINTAILALNDDIEKVKASNSSSSSSGIKEGETYNINISGNANTASKVKNALTLNVGGNATSYDGSSAKTVTIGSNAKLTVATTNTYTAASTTSYDGSTAKTATIYTPDQEVNKTSSPTFNTVTAALNGNATSADKVNNVLTLNVGGTTTSYDGSTAKTVTIGSNAKLTVATTDTYTAASTTEYDGSTAKTATIYTPDQEVNKTSSPTFANPTVTTINGLGFTPKWSAPFIPFVRTDGVTEIGKYVDFHGDAEDSNDYDARIEVTHNSTCKGNGEMTINAANITAAKFSMTHINLYGDSLTFTSPLSDANVSQCWAKAYGNILRIHVAMPMATQTIANSTIIFNLSGAMPTMAYSPTRLVLICDSISLGRYTADIDLDQSGVARIYFAGVAISGSVADISGIYGDCMLTLN